MATRITEQEFKLLRDLIERECGISLTDNKAYLIETRLADLARQHRCGTFGEFYLKAKSSPESATLIARMVDAITTNETSWFRDQYPFNVLTSVLLPELHRRWRDGQRYQVVIWSAGCSTGQEPFSIAMTILDFLAAVEGSREPPNWLKIVATDVSQASLAAAAQGKYDSTSIGRGLTPRHLDLYFHKDGNQWVIDERVKRMVTFRYCNLKGPFLGIGPFDIVFLRNVMIYFAEALKREIFERLNRIILPGGHMFLGTGETVSGYTSAFEIVDCGNGIVYRNRRLR